MAKLIPSAQKIVDQLQALADDLGHVPTREEFDASQLASHLPMSRITGLLHSFEKAVKHVQDPFLRDLTQEQIEPMVKEWSMTNKELLTKTAWTRSVKAGERLPDYDKLVELSGRTPNQLEFLSHDTLSQAGYEPTGSARTRYAKPKLESSTEHEAKSKAVKLKGVRQAPEADDAAVLELRKQEMEARKEAGTRTGRYQDNVDKQGSEDWLGGF